MKVTKSEAFRYILRLVLDAPIPGMRPDLHELFERLHDKKEPYTIEDYMQIQFADWEWAFGVNADLRIGTPLTMNKTKPSGKDVEVQVSWSSGGGRPGESHRHLHPAPPGGGAWLPHPDVLRLHRRVRRGGEGGVDAISDRRHGRGRL